MEFIQKNFSAKIFLGGGGWGQMTGTRTDGTGLTHTQKFVQSGLLHSYLQPEETARAFGIFHEP